MALVNSGALARGLAKAAVGSLPMLWAARYNSSSAVRAWTPPKLSGGHLGPLYARMAGDGETAVVLLHGLVSTGDIFGAGFESLAQSRRLIIPDLLGFGRSLDTSRSSFTVENHLDALDELAEQAGLFERKWTLGAHSMGSALALEWGARHPEQVQRIVCWGAPVYATAAAAQARISEGLMARLFVLDTRWAQRACAISCRHRTLAGWIGAAAEPSLPIQITRAVSLHTWPSYRDAMHHLVLNADWQGLLDMAAEHSIPVDLIWGTHDRVGDHELAVTLAGSRPGINVSLVQGAGHHLPMTHPDVCRGHLVGTSSEVAMRSSVEQFGASD